MRPYGAHLIKGHTHTQQWQSTTEAADAAYETTPKNSSHNNPHEGKKKTRTKEKNERGKKEVEQRKTNSAH